MDLLSVLGVDAYPTVEVSLSRRNLRSLLAKLDGFPKDSAVTLVRQTERGYLIVHGEEDELHYRRQPGAMHSETEYRLAMSERDQGPPPETRSKHA